MFIPSSLVAVWFRGILSIAALSLAFYLASLWYRELPQPAELGTGVSHQLSRTPNESPSSSTLKRIYYWRPALDLPSAILAGAIALSFLSLGGGQMSYWLLRRAGNDEPSSYRSDRQTRLRRPDGTELNIEEFGKYDGVAVILTHGWGMDSTEWYYAKKELMKEHRVVVWDLPGVGLSTKARNNDYSIERFAHDLHAIVEWSGATSVVLVGHSIGGMILQTFSRLFPEHSAIAGIALVHTTYKNPLRTTRFGPAYTMIEKPIIVPLLYLTIALSPLVWLMSVLSYLNGSTHRSTDKQSFSGNETRGQLDFTARFVLVQSPRVLARGMLAMLKFDESANLTKINYPTVVIPAENDPVTLAVASRVLSDSVPAAYSASIPLGKHQAQMEMSEAFLGALRAFIRYTVTSDASSRVLGAPAPRATSITA